MMLSYEISGWIASRIWNLNMLNYKWWFIIRC
jgi:hypothetical protein